MLQPVQWDPPPPFSTQNPLRSDLESYTHVSQNCKLRSAFFLPGTSDPQTRAKKVECNRRQAMAGAESQQAATGLRKSHNGEPSHSDMGALMLIMASFQSQFSALCCSPQSQDPGCAVNFEGQCHGIHASDAEHGGSNLHSKDIRPHRVDRVIVLRSDRIRDGCIISSAEHNMLKP